MKLLDYLKYSFLPADAFGPSPEEQLASMSQGDSTSGGIPSIDPSLPGIGGGYNLAPPMQNAAAKPITGAADSAPVYSAPQAPGFLDRLKALYSKPGAAEALLAFSAVMGKAGGASRLPVSTGEALGQGIEAGMGAYRQRQQDDFMNQSRQDENPARLQQATAEQQRAAAAAQADAQKPPVT